MIQQDFCPHLKVKTGHFGFKEGCDSVCFVDMIVGFLNVT